MTKIYNPRFRVQTFRSGAVTGINYPFFPDKPTEVRDEDVEAFLRQGFEIWKETETVAKKPKRTYSRRRKK